MIKLGPGNDQAAREALREWPSQLRCSGCPDLQDRVLVVRPTPSKRNATLNSEVFLHHASLFISFGTNWTESTL